MLVAGPNLCIGCCTGRTQGCLGPAGSGLKFVGAYTWQDTRIFGSCIWQDPTHGLGPVPAGPKYIAIYNINNNF